MSSFDPDLPGLQSQAHLAVACAALQIAGERLLTLLDISGHTAPELTTDVRFTGLGVSVPVSNADILAVCTPPPSLDPATVAAIRITEPVVGEPTCDLRLSMGDPVAGLRRLEAPDTAISALEHVLERLGPGSITAVELRLGGGAVVELDLPRADIEVLCTTANAPEAQARWHRGLYDGLAKTRSVPVRIWLDDNGVAAVSWRYAAIHGETGARLVAQFGDAAQVSKLAALSEAGRSGEYLDLELVARPAADPGILFHAHP